jgi:alkylhydroperoxidase family enzyme
MAWIETIDDAAAGPELASLYDKVRDPAVGEVDAIMRVHALHPEGLAAHFDLYAAVMRSTPGLRKVDRELIAFTVSRINECHY